jgi:multicomponent Na+:H+ antiporter subunit D
VGYLVFGIWLGLKHNNSEALSASLFYMMQEMIVMAGLFLCVGLIERRAGSDDLHKIGGLLPRAPWLAALTMLLILAMAGVPPLPGFVGKVLFIREGVEAQAWIGTSAYLFASVVTLIVSLRMWARAFWCPARLADIGDLPDGAEVTTGPSERLGYSGICILACGLIACMIAAEPLLQMIGEGTQMLLEPAGYVETVLGPGAWPGTEPSHVALEAAP